MAPAMLTAEQVDALGVVPLHPSPEVTASKLLRLRMLATDSNPRIRESVASSYNTPTDVFEDLARDPDAGVRACVAKNESAPCDVLRSLVDDESERVRGFLAVNFSAPQDAMERLADDPSPLVRDLARWKSERASA
jgi:hypothetical protein